MKVNPTQITLSQEQQEALLAFARQLVAGQYVTVNVKRDPLDMGSIDGVSRHWAPSPYIELRITARPADGQTFDIAPLLTPVTGEQP